MESGFREGKAEFNSTYTSQASGIDNRKKDEGNYVFETHNVSQNTLFIHRRSERKMNDRKN